MQCALSDRYLHTYRCCNLPARHVQSIVLDNDVFVIEHTLPPHNDVFTAPAAFFHYEGWGVFKSKETLAAQLRIAAVLLRKTGRSRPLFAI